MPDQKTTLCKKAYPLLVLFLCSLFLFYKYILQVYPSIMTDMLMRDFTVTAAGLGNLAATFFYAYLVTQLFVGVLIDRFSLRHLVAGAILISALGAWFFAYAHYISEAAIARLMMGMGAAFATVAYMKSAAVWFKPKYFAFIGGLLATVTMIGAVCGQAPLDLIVQQVGWRDALQYCAEFGFVVAALFWLFVRDRDEGLKGTTDRVKFSDVLAILKQPQNWLLTFYSGLTFAPVAVFGGLWGTPYLMHVYHMPHTMVAGLVSMSFLGLAAGGPILGFVSDRLNNRRGVMAFGNILSLITLCCVIYMPNLNTWQLGALLFVFGFGIGAFMLGFALGKDRNPLPMAATVIALINTGDAIFGAITEPMVGKFLDLGWTGNVVNGVHVFSTHDYHMAFMVMPIYLALATLLLFKIRGRAC